MSQQCPILTPAQRQIVDALDRAEKVLVATVYKALADATRQAAEDIQAVDSAERPPAYEYFASVVHRRMFLIMCGADPDTNQGGNLEKAALILESDRKMSEHYWSKNDVQADQEGSASRSI